ncbi:hypothetical protein [Synechococcus sp. CCY 0621]|uniref:hypothetical protein n=1 Tax=Synechococcus sp. CCY 0621 TaxID=2815603 RepID=UPI001C21FF59|nr:hypothetical protein [Synechococcus sp. CCY 0621]
MALLLVFFVVIASVKFGHVVSYSQSQGRLSIPPRPDDIGYQLQAIKDANELRARGWSLGSVEYIFHHRHSPLLNAIGTSSYLVSPPRYVHGSKDWSSFYLPSKVAGFSMLLAIPLLFWCLFRFQAFGLPIFVGTFATYSFAWTGGLITEFRPDLISGLLLGAGVLALCQRAFNERVPLIVAPLFIFASLYAKPTTFLPLFITAGATILLVYLCYARRGLGMAPLRKSSISLAISVSVALLLPFLLINLAPISSYLYKAFVTDSRIWGGPFEGQSLIERLSWYLQPSGGGAISLPLNNLILIVSIVFFLVVRLALCRRLGSELSHGYYKGFALALLCGAPYFLMASVSNNKSYFLGAFIGIFMSLLLAGILATLVLELSLSGRRLLHSLALLLVACMGVLAMAAPPPEAFLWSAGNSLQARMLHRDTVDQALALLSQSPALSRANSRVFVAATESLHGDLVEAYLQIQSPRGKSFHVTDGENVTGQQELIREIDSADIIVFESGEIAPPSYAFDLYMPSVQSHLQQMAKGGKDLQVLETKARVRMKNGRSQGVLIMSRL